MPGSSGSLSGTSGPSSGVHPYLMPGTSLTSGSSMPCNSGSSDGVLQVLCLTSGFSGGTPGSMPGTSGSSWWFSWFYTYYFWLFRWRVPPGSTPGTSRLANPIKLKIFS